MENASPQNELLAVVVQGNPLEKWPTDLYVPVDALQVFLESFEGPLDLLLYLIQHQNLDVLDIPIAEVTSQYIKYVELMREIDLNLAAEYLVMAAILTEIKSRMLLPSNEANVVDESDPRSKLVQQLREYARYKQAAQDLDALPRLGRDLFPIFVDIPEFTKEIVVPDVGWNEMLEAMRDVMERATLFTSHQIMREPLSVRERMSFILENLKTIRRIEFVKLFTVEEGRAGVVVTLLAILELTKESLIQIVQTQAFDVIEVVSMEE